MKQKIEALKVEGAEISSSIKFIFVYYIESISGSGDSNKKGDSNWYI
jgi:hypothetical protein